MNEVNALVWPSPNGIGIMDPALWQQTVDVSLGAGIITEAPPADAYRTDLAQEALGEITDDTKGADFQKGVVEITEGGN
jgi:NitT/TauT family transport system substrate-binding protein